MKPLNFTVERSKWLRGSRGPDDGVVTVVSRLQNRDGHMCCMGFYARARGGEQCTLALADHLSYLPSEIELELADNDLMNKIYSVNDNPSISDKEREASLTELLALCGVGVEFVD